MLAFLAKQGEFMAVSAVSGSRRSSARSIDRSWATRTFIKIQNNIWVVMGKLEVHDGSTLVTEMQKSVFMKFVEQIHNAHIAK
jgi:hypothetical protein